MQQELTPETLKAQKSSKTPQSFKSIVSVANFHPEIKFFMNKLERKKTRITPSRQIFILPFLSTEWLFEPFLQHNAVSQWWRKPSWERWSTTFAGGFLDTRIGEGFNTDESRRSNIA